ncbi:MAG: fasciclin domain-containing protein, partial [Bacteroidaceae bacterium]|nr:fasciclin domain-containing protein [Bacteroidaceae bacterium]
MHYPYVKTWTYDFEDHYGKHVSSTLNTYIEPTPTLDVLAVGEKTYLRHLEQIGDVTNTYYMRQEKECIYIYDDSQKAEHMLYDFGLSEGDEYVDPYDGVRYKVQEVSDTLMVSHEEWLNTSYQKYKVLRLCSTDGRDIQDTWIEGIGSVHYGLLRPGLHSEFIHQNLLTCDWGFESARHKFHYNLPYLKTTAVESYSLGYGKPEEDDDYPKWLYGKDLEYEFLSDTLHVTGRSAVHGGHIDYAICTQNGGKLTVSLFESQSLIEGIGQVHVDAYFPGFAEGTYTVNGKELSCKGHTSKAPDEEPDQTIENLLPESASDISIYRWAQLDGTDETKTSYMPQRFHEQLRALNGERCVLLMPTDEALKSYVDAASLDNSTNKMMVSLLWKDADFPIRTENYRYDAATGTVGGRMTGNLASLSQSATVDYLAMMLESHTIALTRPEDAEKGLNSGNCYFRAMDGSVIKVQKDGNGDLAGVQGAFQMQNEQAGLEAFNQCAIERSWHNGNFDLYKIAQPVIHSPHSVQWVLKGDGADCPFSAFYDLTCADRECLTACGFTNVEELLPYISSLEDRLNYTKDKPFTLFVPTNKAIEMEINNGLPTWQSIRSHVDAHTTSDANGKILWDSEENRQRVAKECLTLINFIKAHVMMGVEIADQLPFTRTHASALINSTGETAQLEVSGKGNEQMTVSDGEHVRTVLASKNIFTVDKVRSYPAGPISSTSARVFSYHPGVIHQIDGVLSYAKGDMSELPATIAYRPFVEEGKVWKLGRYEYGADPKESEPTHIEYQYLQGDTIIGGLQYKRCLIANDENMPAQYVGAVREDEGIVSSCIQGAADSQKIYDFTSPAGTSEWYHNWLMLTAEIYHVTLGERHVIDTETYKGCGREVSFNGKTITWLQGVGYVGLFNLPAGYCLLSCTVGDEVLYYDASLMPKDFEVKKKKLDFTHVVKAQPKAPSSKSRVKLASTMPSRERGKTIVKAPQHDTEQEGPETLKGEYSSTELFVHLNGLFGTYAITLTDEAGNEVYAKDVLTDNVLALNTDLLTYEPGSYTLTVENAYEKFVTTLNLTTD